MFKTILKVLEGKCLVLPPSPAIRAPTGHTLLYNNNVIPMYTQPRNNDVHDANIIESVVEKRYTWARSSNRVLYRTVFSYIKKLPVKMNRKRLAEPLPRFGDGGFPRYRRFWTRGDMRRKTVLAYEMPTDGRKNHATVSNRSFAGSLIGAHSGGTDRSCAAATNTKHSGAYKTRSSSPAPAPPKPPPPNPRIRRTRNTYNIIM